MLLVALLVAAAVVAVTAAVAVAVAAARHNAAREQELLAELRAEALEALEALEAEDFKLGGNASSDLGAIAEEEDGPAVAKGDAADTPACVRLFLAHAVRDRRRFRMFTIVQDLELRFSLTGRWRAGRGVQTLSPLTPAFLFAGRLPLLGRALWARGGERLVRGRAATAWRLFGALGVAGAEGGEALTRGALARWLVEGVCAPQALAPSRFLSWKAVPGRADAAEATVAHAGASASAVFTFDSRGNVVEARTDDYARAAPRGGGVARAGMVARCRGHMCFGLTPRRSALALDAATTGGVVIPTRVEAAFVGADGVEEPPYLRLAVLRVEAE
jgi:hypothetical protein